MNTADVAAEVKCLRRLIGMRCSNVYDLSPKVLLILFLPFILSCTFFPQFNSFSALCRPTCSSWWTAVEYRNRARARRFFCWWKVAWDCTLLSTCVTRATLLLVSLSNWGSTFGLEGSRMCVNLGTIGYSIVYSISITLCLFPKRKKNEIS